MKKLEAKKCCELHDLGLLLFGFYLGLVIVGLGMFNGVIFVGAMVGYCLNYLYFKLRTNFFDKEVKSNG